MKPMTPPRLTLGASNWQTILDAHVDVLVAIDHAIAAVNKTSPNGRDYQSAADPRQATDDAVAAWRERRDALREIRKDFEAVAFAIRQQERQ